MSDKRNNVLARLACAGQSLDDAKETLQGIVSLYIDADDDEHGDQRQELLDVLADLISNAAMSAHAAILAHKSLSRDELIIVEYEDDDREDEDEEDEDEDGDEAKEATA